MLLNEEGSYGVAWMCQSFEWIYWNDDAFMILPIGLLVWGWFRVMNVYRWVLRLGLPRKKKKKRKQCRRNWRNGTKEFNGRKLPYNLVRRCCCRRERLGQRPPRHDGNRLPSLGLNRRWRRMKKRQRCNQTRKEEQSAREKQMREFIEFCELSRPKPRHVDAPVWESLLNWLCFESPCSDDFPANGRVNADPIVKTNDELASRLKEFIEEEEDHDVNVTRLLSRAAEHKAGGPEQKRNSHQHIKTRRFHSVLRPFQGLSFPECAISRHSRYLTTIRTKHTSTRHLLAAPTMITGPDRSRRHMIASAMSRRSLRAAGGLRRLSES
ncbi:hypothetical protein THAOC_29129 [Thalassiosira oceanica]|uniref:Uncharacterized protein n=1 Tax=Thalassiosira oceanica TaxID=159749 RepID=K0RDA4_THAOC|nr:hypothetical protein THAOC_29129 [Thalassiosira oceanica]|eukprot:EJK51678.1 hypothetical protein THAOC_29129 [Thalassiosira oceanica]